MPGKVIISVPHIFDRVQRSKAAHQKGLSGMMKLQETAPEQFTEEFMLELRRVLTVKRKETCVERLLEFAVSFATKTPTDAVRNNELQPFALFLLDSFIALCRASNAYVKFWSTYLVAALLSNMPEECEIDDKLFEKILLAMRERAFDTAARTRVEAIRALGRLQDPTNPQCPVMPALLLLLVHDQAVTVRKAVLQNIALTKASIDPIIGRTRDVSTEVRKYAFQILSLKVEIRMLKVEQRVQLLDAGLRDREAVVRAECHKLLQNWLSGFQDQPLEVLKCLQVDVYESVASEAIRSLITNRHIESKIFYNLIDQLEESILSGEIDTPLTPEMALFWRTFVEEQIHTANETGGEDESVQSCTNLEITQFCILIKQQMALEAGDFVLLQLLKLARSLDLSDEAGRRMLSIFLSDLIITPETSDDMLLEVFDLLRRVFPRDAELIPVVVESLQVVGQPLEQFRSEDKVQRLEDHLKELQGQLDELSGQYKKEKDKSRRSHLKSLMRNIQEEAQPMEEQLEIYDSLTQYVYTRTLMSLSRLFQLAPTSIQDERFTSFKTVMLQESLAHFSPEVLAQALQCAVHLALLDESQCATYLPFFCRVITEGEASEQYSAALLETALRGFFDLLLWHGWEVLERLMGSKTTKQVMRQLLAHLDYDGKDNFQRMVDLQDRLKFVYEHYASEKIDYDDEVKCAELFRSVVVEGFAKVLLLDRFPEEHKQYDEVLFQLIVLFYSPDTMYQYLIRQCLTLFFSAYSTSPQPSHQNALQRMVLRCFRAVLQADSAAVAHIDNSQLCAFLLSLTQPSKDSPLFDLRCTVHQNLAQELAEEIVEQADQYSAQQLTYLTNLLHQCALVNARYEVLDALLSKTTQAAEAVPQQQVRKALVRARTVIESLMADTDLPTESDEEEEDEPQDEQLLDEEDDAENRPERANMPSRVSLNPASCSDLSESFERLDLNGENLAH